MESYEAIIRGLIAQNLSISADKIKWHTDLADEFCLDSLDGVEIIMMIEDEFNIEIDMDTCKFGESGDKSTFGDLVDLVIKIRSGK